MLLAFTTVAPAYDFSPGLSIVLMILMGIGMVLVVAGIVGRIIGDLLSALVRCVAIGLLCPPFSSAADENVLYEQRIMPWPLPITVPVTIANQVQTFVLDTGATGYMADLRLKQFVGSYRENKSITTI